MVLDDTDSTNFAIKDGLVSIKGRTKNTEVIDIAKYLATVALARL